METKTPANEYEVDVVIGTDFTQEWHDKTNMDIKRKLHLQDIIVRHVVDHCDITDRRQMANAWEMVAELGKLLRG